MGRILFIDYLSCRGHMNFNKIHIDVFQNLGYEIHLVGVQGQFENITNKGNIKIYNISDGFLIKHHSNPLMSRIKDILFLFKVKQIIRVADYDLIIFPTYDILSVFFFRTKRNVILINHNNVSQLWSKVKRWMTCHLPSNYIHVALSQEMKRRMEELNPYRKCYYVPHGIIQPSNDFKKPLFIRNKEKYIFCPVNRNHDLKLIENIFASQYVNDYLKNAKIKLLVKKISDSIHSSENIFVIDLFIEKTEYDYLIKNACAVLLPYDKSFQYRCSGIMFECIAYKTPIIASDIPALRSFENECEIKFFRDDVTFVDTIKSISTIFDNVFKLDKFNPLEYWRELLSKISK